MFTKESLKNVFESDWKTQYEVELFRREGFVRKRCPKCGKHFWTVDQDRVVCGDPPCENYGFIGKSPAKKKWDYIEMWKEFERFFVKNGHMTVGRYPVVDRWRPDLFFTIASIQDFQRIDNGKMSMEYPGDPLIVPQVCLRFPDISNVGVTGRHHTSFIMGGQHSFGNYWKDRCIDLNFGFLHGVMGIPKEKLVYIESLWAMPDFSQFGPSLETISMGLELVNSVFSQYTKAGNGYVELPQKVIDVGWGHERLVWFSQGTHTSYESAFGPVIEWAKKQAGLKHTELFDRYSVVAGGLDFDEVKNIEKARGEVASKLGVSVEEINRVVEPMQALYAMIDHMKTLLFAVTDGMIPSNVGGGYNLRVILRRSLSFMEEFGFSFDLMKIAELHAKFLKPLFPELEGGLVPLSKIMEVERERYENTKRKAGVIVSKLLEKGKPKEEELIRLYTSNGVTPELVRKASEKAGKPIEIPEDFYSRITEKHISGKEDASPDHLDASETSETRMMFYDDPYAKEFDAVVIKVSGEWVVLDQTLFYPEGGGQPHDLGSIDDHEVTEVKKVAGVVFHKTKGQFRHGQNVHGNINWERRYQLMKMHTATHLIAGAARHVIGSHIWQAGAHKGVELSRIDLTHYSPFTPGELESVSALANEMVKKAVAVDKSVLERSEAETNYGFVLYQGGASPGKKVRVIKIMDGKSIFDVEACGGTHLDNTKEIGRIKIVRSERIQDGVNRIEFTAGGFVGEMNAKEKSMLDHITREMSAVLDISTSSDPVSKQLRECCETLSVPMDQLEATVKKFMEDLTDGKHAHKQKAHGAVQACSMVFAMWKEHRKRSERLVEESAGNQAEAFLKKEKGGRILEHVDMDRKEMIKLAESIISRSPKTTVILVSRSGDVVGMSKVVDIVKEVKEFCAAHGGSGGGKGALAQGKIDPKKLKG